jgi:tetratricopeptide (TPR) repeat protein
MVRAAALLLVIGTIAFAAFYLLDRHTSPGPTLAERTIAQTEEGVRQDPNNVGLRLKLAAAYLASNRTKDAASQYDAVLQAAPDNVGALLGKAGILAASGDASGAGLLYQKVVDIRKGGEMAAADTDLEHAYFGLGTSASDLGQYAEAIAALESAVRIDGTDADAWYALGVAQLGAGVPEKAVQAERNAVTFVPLGWSDPYTVMAKAYTAQGKTANAAWAQAMVDLIAKRYPEAKAQLLALATGPAAPDATLGLAFLAETQGDTAGALDWYRKALALNPKSTTAADGVSRMAGSSAGPSLAPASAAPMGS